MRDTTTSQKAAVQRAIERAVDGRNTGPILRTSRGTRMDRHPNYMLAAFMAPGT